jgi:hypothetical protein
MIDVCRTEEAPGEVIHQGRSYYATAYWALVLRSRAVQTVTCEHGNPNADKLVPEGIEGRVSTELNGRHRSRWRAAFARQYWLRLRRTIDVTQNKAEFVEIPRPVFAKAMSTTQITKEAPNYRADCGPHEGVLQQRLFFFFCPETILMQHHILIPDFGPQVTQLIARRVRDAHVFCDPCDVTDEWIREYASDGTSCGDSFSSSHASVYEDTTDNPGCGV